jgi:hypothetical protein
MQDYLACVASVDENVGRVLDYLDESGLGKKHIGDLYIRPGILSRAEWLV